MAVTRLTQDQQNALNQAERILHDALPDIDGLEKCGVDCQQLRADNARYRQQIASARAAFVTGGQGQS